MKQILQTASAHTIWMSAGNPEDREMMNTMNANRARQLFPPKSLVIIDEAQRLENAGLTLKIIHDNCPEIQLAATGSNAFEITDKIREALTGRKWSLSLYPFSMEELIRHAGELDLIRTLETRLIFGSYPEVINQAGNEKVVLNELMTDYLYNDLFRLKEVRKPDLLEKLVRALAFRIGNQVSNRELANLLQVDKETIDRYLRLLEEAFIIFRLPSFARNLTNELKTSKKIYFTDNGIRNAVINQFGPTMLRNDTGVLWENLMITERRKYNEYHRNFPKVYFWRTTAQQEIDYLEEADGKLFAYEFKWQSPKNVKCSSTFRSAYPEAEFTVVTKDNLVSFIVK
jgi:predicted AAA+ superfamily ATPase